MLYPICIHLGRYAENVLSFVCPRVIQRINNVDVFSNQFCADGMTEITEEERRREGQGEGAE